MNEEYIERMEDVLNLYKKKYDEQEPVVCLDEKTVQLLEDPVPLIPMKEKEVIKRDPKYKRKGMANVYCVVEAKAGKHLTYVTGKKTGVEFAKLMHRIARVYRRARKIHLVMDNYGTHSQKGLVEKYGEKMGKEIWGRFRIHYTPKNASWLNQAEIEIGIYSKQCLGKNRIPSVQELRRKTYYWNREANRKKMRILWNFTTKEARKKFNYGK